MVYSNKIYTKEVLMKKITYFSIILILLIGFPNVVSAANENTGQFNICLDNKYFSVTYDKNKQAITKDMIILGSDGKPAINKTLYPDLNNYKVDFTSIDANCRNVNNTIILCPENGSDYTYSKIQEAYIKDGGNITDNISFNLNYSTSKFTVKIKDVFNDKIYVRYQNDVKLVNGNNDKDGHKVYEFGTISRGETLQKGSDGYYQITGVDSQKQVYLEFYVKDNSSACKGTFIGYIGFFTPSTSDYTLDNPAISNPNAYGCTAVKNYVPTGMTNQDDLNKLNDMKKSYIYECYNPSKMSYGYIGPNGSTLKNTITKKYNNLQSMFNSYTISQTLTTNVCTDTYHQGPKITSTYYGSYWSMVCTESYEATGSEAKLVRAGNGFSYQANYVVSRQCSITQINKPTKAPQCNYSIGHTCSWPTRSGTDTGNDGGPNGSFDACIMQCDNGKYSQECINSCYKSVYNKERKLSINNSILKKEGRIEFTGLESSESITSANGDECTTDHGRPGHKINYSSNGVSDTACFSDNYCATHGGECTFNVYKGPDGCSDNPDDEYNSALNASENELRMLQAQQQEELKAGNYTYQITDSYLKTDKNQPYVYTVSSENNPMVSVNKIETTANSNYQQQSLGNSGGRDVSYYATVTRTANITTNLPLSYVSKNGGNAIYKTNESDKQIFTVNHQNNRIDSKSSFNLADYYHETNERKYYTSIYSGNKNVVQTDDGSAIMLVSRNNANVNVDYNILVTSKDVGAGEFGSDIKCYYGVYNDFYVCDDDDCPPPTCTDPPCPTITPTPPTDCTGDNCDKPLDQSGIQYIYRDIDLTDVFPNERNPRWNWTSGAASVSSKNQLKYDIDPIKLTKEIESKGESIYDVQKDASEVDYEFVLTKENLKNIRAYNKRVRDYNGDGANNHLDFNMSCYTNSQGKNVCSSRFLDNIDGNSGSESSSNFITYSVSNFTIDARKNLIGCNNSKNLQCNDTYH